MNTNLKNQSNNYIKIDKKPLVDLSPEKIRKIKKDFFFSYKKEWECRYMTNSVYKEFFDRIINNIMVKKGCFFHIVFVEDREAGWILTQGDILHYVYLNKEFRFKPVYDAMSLVLFSIFKDVLGRQGKIETTFISYLAFKILDKKVSFNPFKRFF